MNGKVPTDFPFPPVGSALAGAQLKFSVSRDRDGLLREAGASLADRERDFARCTEVLAWGVEFLREKSLKPKYLGVPPEALLAKLRVNLERDFQLPPVYQAWILGRLSKLLERG